jgi:CBS domain-containing protein
MAQKVRDVMTAKPVFVPASSTIAEAAMVMRDRNIGDVLVERDGELCGMVTDRDIVVRAIADGMDPNRTPIGDNCSRNLVTIDSKADAEEAVRTMRDNALRRIPVTEDGKVVGIVSIGDLAQQRDKDSALADISAAPPNR